MGAFAALDTTGISPLSKVDGSGGDKPDGSGEGPFVAQTRSVQEAYFECVVSGTRPKKVNTMQPGFKAKAPKLVPAPGHCQRDAEMAPGYSALGTAFLFLR